MQAIMMNSEEIEIIDPTSFLPVDCELGEISNSRSGQPVPLVELGKQLYLSAQEGDITNVRHLITKGAPFTTDWLGTSPLHIAARDNKLELAEILLRSGISKDARTKVERTPLHLAAQEGHTEIVRLLLSCDADINALDMLKMTPLHWAVERGHFQTVKLLLNNGAISGLRNKFGKTVFDIAEDNQDLEIQNILNMVESKINMENDTFVSTTNLGIDLGHVPAATKVEEVSTSTSSSTSKVKEKSIHPKKHVKVKPASDPKISFISNESDIIANSPTLQLLQAHGITMLPADNSNLIASAVESGQTVVLTEAGKLALENIQIPPTHCKKPSGAIIRKAPVQTITIPKKKLITIKTSDVITVPKTPNILKKEPPKTVPKVTRTVSISELEAMTKELAEARRQAEEYRLLLCKKEKEAEQYKQQLESIVNLK